MTEVVAVVRDLLFSTKIDGTSRALGISAATVSTQTALSSVLDGGEVRLVMVDMSLNNDEALAALRCGADHPWKPTTIAFYSHVQSELRDAAEQAGADLVMARSKFSAQLPQLLNLYCSGADRGQLRT